MSYTSADITCWMAARSVPDAMSQRGGTIATSRATNRAANRPTTQQSDSRDPRPASVFVPLTRNHTPLYPTSTTNEAVMHPSLVSDPLHLLHSEAPAYFDYSTLHKDMADHNQEIGNHGEDHSIIDLRRLPQFESNTNQEKTKNHADSCRVSGSSFAFSYMAETPPYEDFNSSVAGSERLSFISDSDAWSSLDFPAITCSPIVSPRNSYHEALRSSLRSRASPAPYNNMRSSPYTFDSGRSKRWSTGMYASSPAPQRTTGGQNNNRHSVFYGSHLNPSDVAQAYTQEQKQSLSSPPNNMRYVPASHAAPAGSTLYSSSEQTFAPELTRQLPSQGLFRLLQSNSEQRPRSSSHLTNLSDPPDLYTSLEKTPCDPPEEDMHPSDPDLKPHKQDLRFAGDLYTPRWVRGHGNKREGWCGLCKPGRWLVLKNSAFWYDKSFSHGVSAATGAAFQSPQDTRRSEGNLDLWEGLCGSCGDWVALVSSKKKGTTWFRHAYKCHTHPKVKDISKRKRETGTLRARALYDLGNESSIDLSSPILPPKNEPPLLVLPPVPSKQNPALSNFAVKDESTDGLDEGDMQRTPRMAYIPITTAPDDSDANPTPTFTFCEVVSPTSKRAGMINPLPALGGMI